MEWRCQKNADILFGASEQSALAIIRDHKDSFSEKDIQPLYLRKSILLVKKGNPKNIRSIDDLTRPGIGVIVNDGGGTSNTSGTGVWEDIAGRKGNIETVAAIRKNIILYAPNSGTARKALENQPGADVWITWADWAASNPEIGDVVEIAPDYVIWRDMNITVRQDANDETRRFAEWLQTDEAAPAFKKYGWTRKGTWHPRPSGRGFFFRMPRQRHVGAAHKTEKLYAKPRQVNWIHSDMGIPISGENGLL